MCGVRGAACGFGRAAFVARAAHDVCAAVFAECLFGFAACCERLVARARKFIHGLMGGGPIIKHSGPATCPYHVEFLRHAAGVTFDDLEVLPEIQLASLLYVADA